MIFFSFCRDPRTDRFGRDPRDPRDPRMPIDPRITKANRKFSKIFLIFYDNEKFKIRNLITSL